MKGTSGRLVIRNREPNPGYHLPEWRALMVSDDYQLITYKIRKFSIFYHSLQSKYLFRKLLATEFYTEKELLLRIADGDQAAFTQIVHHYTSVVYHHLITYVKDTYRAKELTQDVFVSIWNSRSKLSDIQNFPAYMHVVSRNKAKKALLDLAKNASSPPDDMVEYLLQAPEIKLELKELQQLLNKAIDLLPVRRREVFRLSRFQNLSYEEIAQHLGISKSAVKQHIIAALVDLRIYLKDHGGIIVSALLWTFLY